jgi:hypothetical protein
MNGITTQPISTADMQAYGGTTYAARIYSHEDSDGAIDCITDITGLQAHSYNSEGDYLGFYQILGSQKLAQYILAKTRPEDLRNVLQNIADWIEI